MFLVAGARFVLFRQLPGVFVSGSPWVTQRNIDRTYPDQLRSYIDAEELVAHSSEKNRTIAQ